MSATRQADPTAVCGDKRMFENETMTDQNNITLVSIREAVEEIVQNFHPRSIFLFGSYAYGTPTSDSDVDLMISMETSLRNIDQAAKIRQLIHFNFPLDLLVRTPQQLKERLAMGDPFIEEIVYRGKILYEARLVKSGSTNQRVITKSSKMNGRHKILWTMLFAFMLNNAWKNISRHG